MLRNVVGCLYDIFEPFQEMVAFQDDNIAQVFGDSGQDHIIQ